MPKSSRFATALPVGLMLALLGAVGCGGSSENDPLTIQAGGTQIRKSTVLHWERAIRLGAVSSPGATDRAKAVGYLTSGNWAIEEAAKEGLTAPSAAVKQWMDERLDARSPNPPDADRELAAKGQDMRDLEFEARVALSIARLRERAWNQVAVPSQAEVQSYYDHHRGLYFHESRAVDLIEKLGSRASATAVARKLGIGRRFAQHAIHEMVTEATIAEKEHDMNGGLVRAIFAAPAHRLGGPVLYVGRWVVFVVRHIYRESLPLAAVSEEIGTRLRSANQLQALEAFASSYRREWSAKTTCRTGFVAPGCSESHTALSPTVNSLAE